MIINGNPRLNRGFANNLKIIIGQLKIVGEITHKFWKNKYV